MHQTGKLGQGTGLWDGSLDCRTGGQSNSAPVRPKIRLAYYYHGSVERHAVVTTLSNHTCLRHTKPHFTRLVECKRSQGATSRKRQRFSDSLLHPGLLHQQDCIPEGIFSAVSCWSILRKMCRRQSVMTTCPVTLAPILRPVFGCKFRRRNLFQSSVSMRLSVRCGQYPRRFRPCQSAGVYSN